jgi:nicotinate-nucleotide adenylyltransferase
VTGLFGGTFDPPHNGHLALAHGALEHFALERLLVLVVVDPGHRTVALDFDLRFKLAELAFGSLPRTEILREDHPFTVDAVRGGRFGEAIFLIGADEFAAFPSWKDPNGVLEEVRLGVATRPGFSRELLEEVLSRLDRPERVEFFEIPETPVSSSDVRVRVAAGEPIADHVPESVAREIDSLGLYR